MDKQAGGWGLETLRRDILAEKFIRKIFQDGVRRHMADPKVQDLCEYSVAEGFYILCNGDVLYALSRGGSIS